LDTLLRAEFAADDLDDPVQDDWPAEEPLPVSAFRPPVLAPDVLDLPESMAERAELHLAEIGISDRMLNTLEEAGLQLVGELLYRRPEQLLALPQFGPAMLEELYLALARLGFHRKPRETSTELNIDAGEGPCS
jgi:DNA-directed RNA polymerase alpha subunit